MILTVCICTFAGASGVCAADIDDVALDNQSMEDIEILDDDQILLASIAENAGDSQDVVSDVPEEPTSNISLGFALTDFAVCQQITVFQQINITDNLVFVNQNANLTKEIEYSSQHPQCNDRPNITLNSSANAVCNDVSDEITGNDFSDSYSYYTQTTACRVMIVPSVMDEDEVLMGFRSLKGMSEPDYGQETLKSAPQDNSTSGLDADNDFALADLPYHDSENSNYNALKFNFSCSDLNISDYNLEYSIAADPHLIVVDSISENTNSDDAKKHHLNLSDAENTIAEPLTFNNSKTLFGLNLNVDDILNDIKTAFCNDSISANEMDEVNSLRPFGQSTIFMSNDDLIFGGITRPSLVISMLSAHRAYIVRLGRI